MAVHELCVENFKVSYSNVGEGGVAVNCEKAQFFLNTLYNVGSTLKKYVLLKGYGSVTF